MKLLIKNSDNSDAQDYTMFLEEGTSVHRLLNGPAELKAALVATSCEFVVPPTGARVELIKNDGDKLFTGYVVDPPVYEYLGWGMSGPMYRYTLAAISDECLLDRKMVPARAPLVGRSAGEALKILTEDVLPGAFDTSAVDDVEILGYFEFDSRKTWSQHAVEIACRGRACYRVHNGKLILNAIPPAEHEISESTAGLPPGDLKLECIDRVVNEYTIVGKVEPQAYVKNYFCGDGLSMRFDLSEIPFTRQNRILLDEEFKGGTLDPVQWSVSGSPNSVSVSGGRLCIESSGPDGSTVVQFTGDIELGGALILQHGQVNFTAPSSGLIGGLYAGAVNQANCLAGFQISPNGGQCKIQAVVNGGTVEPSITTVAGHQYTMTTRLYASEIYRSKELFHSSVHQTGNPRGGQVVPADVRVVMELHDLDPGNPGSGAGPATVLYDGLLLQAPASCSYALFNAGNLHADVTFTRITRPVDAEVRSAPPGQGYRTRLPGALSEGGECSISQSPALQFFTAYVPQTDEKIAVRYRATGRSIARVNDPTSIAASRTAHDNGVFGSVCQIGSPQPRTSADCTNAALALLDDSVRKAWAGEYKIWSDFLDASDIFPGDEVSISYPSRGANFCAIVREVQIALHDLRQDRAEYTVRFADDRAEPLALQVSGVTAQTLPLTTSVALTNLKAGLAALTAAEVVDVQSTTVTIDTGITPAIGSGIEARRSDAGWGGDNDRNLIGRFGTRLITLPRLSRVKNYFLRQYDASSPANYSEFSTAIYVDYPL